MNVPLLFIISAPRSGSTLLERMLERHSAILGGPEPHLLTPLAHLGVWDKVDKAPYDHVLAAEAQKGFIECLPGGESDYWQACRAYADHLYGKFLEGSGRQIVLDKTPAYGLILPFLEKVFPDAKYVVLTRHPAAVFSSYANSFFDGDYQTAHNYNPLLERYVPAIGSFLRNTTTAHYHVQYETLVSEPDETMAAIQEFLGVPQEPGIVDYGNEKKTEGPKGLGDPLGVDKQTRPTDASIAKWAEELAASPEKRALVQKMIDALADDDLETWGYPRDVFWAPMEGAGGGSWTKPKMNRYRLQRKAIVTFRGMVQRSPGLRQTLKKGRLALDVLLRE